MVERDIRKSVRHGVLPSVEAVAGRLAGDFAEGVSVGGGGRARGGAPFFYLKRKQTIVHQDRRTGILQGIRKVNTMAKRGTKLKIHIRKIKIVWSGRIKL